MTEPDHPVQQAQTFKGSGEQQSAAHLDLPLPPSLGHTNQPSIAEEDEEEELENENENHNEWGKEAGDHHDDEKYAARPPSVVCTSTLSRENSVDQQLRAVNDRIEAHRIQDELEVLRAERQISMDEDGDVRSKSRMHNPEPEDAFNKAPPPSSHTNKRNKNAAIYKIWAWLRKMPRFVRYWIYLFPVALVLLAPVFLGYVAGKDDRQVPGPHGVQVMWFGIWLEIVWCSLWLSRMVANLIPPVVGGVAKLIGSCNDEQFKTVCQRLEMHLALLLWMIASFVSFKPFMYKHGHAALQDGDEMPKLKWVENTDKALIALLVLAGSNFVEKILIYVITTTFHQRTYSTRIQHNATDIEQLIKLFEHVKRRKPDLESDFWMRTSSRRASGAQTPMQAIGHGASRLIGKVGQVAEKVGNDLIGRKVKANHARKVVNELLRSDNSAKALARQIYKCTVSEGQEMVHLEDLLAAFVTPEEAEAAFTMFDKDMNGDISLQEMEEVCREIHLEKKAIASSLKDLDSVTGKLDRVFLALIVLVAIIVFVCIVSKAGAAGITSAGTSILGLAWMLQATAQEFLQSIIFVFIKHPFDVGDRVTIYGSTGATLTGDDYYVAEISLLYTEFRKLQGHVVQAPNSVLNTLFILNQRRSTNLTDSIPLQMRFGTSAEQIEELKARMLEFVKMHKRDYQPNIITEMTTFDQVRSCTMNMVFWHKGNFQNELMRLNRHNRFATELMRQMVLVGIESPLRTDPGGSREYPIHWSNIPPQLPQSRPKEPHSSSMAPMAHRTRRAYSVRSEQGAVAEDDIPSGVFQDVYEGRREQVNVRRMESIREKERGLRLEEEATETRGASGLSPVDSASQTRNRFFGRARSRTLSSAQNDVV